MLLNILLQTTGVDGLGFGYGLAAIGAGIAALAAGLVYLPLLLLALLVYERA